MIHLVLDTNIYYKSPRQDSAEFKLLSHMIEKDCLVLHVPHVIERERTSQLELDQRGKLDAAITNLSSALNYSEHGPQSIKLKASLEDIKENLDTIIAERSAAFVDWLNKNNAVRHSLTLEQTKRALDAYFKGLPPLKEPKARKDIPDSYIFQQILDLKETYQSQLGIVVEDSALRSACENAGISCWVNLREFISSPVAQEFLVQTVIKDNTAEISDHVHHLAISNIEEITSVLETALLSNDYTMLTGDSILGEFHEIYLSGVNTPYVVEVADIDYLGGTVFLADVRARVELLYEFLLFKDEMYDLDFDKYNISQHNDYYYQVETTDTFQFSASIVLEFPETAVASMTVDEMVSKLQEPTISADDLEAFQIVDDDDIEHDTTSI